MLHGSSFWCKMISSLRQSETGTHVLSSDKIVDTEPHLHHHRAVAIYEKQLFCEKMVTACYLNSVGLSEWQKLLHHKTISKVQRDLDGHNEAPFRFHGRCTCMDILRKASSYEQVGRTSTCLSRLQSPPTAMSSTVSRLMSIARRA